MLLRCESLEPPMSQLGDAVEKVVFSELGDSSEAEDHRLI